MSISVSAEYYPDEPAPDYEPEYRGVNDSWQSRCNAPCKPATPPLKLLMLRGNASTHAPRTVTLSLVPIRALSIHDEPDYQAKQLEEIRRAGTTLIINTARDLELTAHCFRLEADKNALLEAEPHLRRVARALGVLTRAASRARKFNARPAGLFDE